MSWKRRQSTWPYVVALGCVFALTLAAPSWWRHRRDQSAERDAARGERIAAPAAPRAGQSASAPSLPPLARQTSQVRPGLNLDPTVSDEPAQIAAPSLAGAVVDSNEYDYVVVDEPLREASADAVVAAPGAPPAAVAHSFAQQGAGQSLETSDTPLPAPPAPSQPAISVESLVRARDTLLSLLGDAQLRIERAVQETAARRAAERPRPQPLRIVVESENDRLAMVPDMTPPQLSPDPMPAPIGPRIAIAPTPEMMVEPELAPAPQVARLPDPPQAPPALRHRPVALLRDLDALATFPSAGPWANAVRATIDQLLTTPRPSQLNVAGHLDDLQRDAQDGLRSALDAVEPGERSAWTRAARALERRLPLWRLLLDDAVVAELARPRSTPAIEAALLQSIHEVAALTAGTEAGAAWRDYLRLDDLAGLTSIGGSDYEEARRAAARDVLIRMADPWLTDPQREFLAQPELVSLAINLHAWASGPVSLDSLAALLEDYELTGSLGDAEAISEQRMRMKWADDARLERLAAELNRNYRNANVRMALSADMFNRMIPPQAPTVTTVNDRIAGAQVRGRSRTETHVRVRLMPDERVWRMGLEVEGVVNSRTYSDVGPARVRNASRMEYEARKLIMINRFGLQLSPAESRTDGRNRLTGVESRFELVPILGAVVEEVVREQHREHQASAIAQVKAKVNRQARQRMDREADAKLHELEARFAQNLLQPLERFAIVAEPVDMSTTDERAVMRLRLAGEHHLGAHTPRPSAPSDSLASLQLHHSALNNAARGLELDGRRLTVAELHELLGSKFTNRTEAPPADLPQRAIVEFAAHDAVRVACHEDCVELTLNIVELRKGRDSIRNVIVHAFFRPVVDGLEVKLVRDGSLQFEGAHLRSGTRLVLHSVFGKLLRRDQEIPVITPTFRDDPRFAGLMVTQLVIDDGWIALSLGPASPERTAWRTRSTVR
jgi:hypothetical protein